MSRDRSTHATSNRKEWRGMGQPGDGPDCRSLFYCSPLASGEERESSHCRPFGSSPSTSWSPPPPRRAHPRPLTNGFLWTNRRVP